MNCFNHSETPAVAYCRTCGKALCENCKRPARGTVYCEEHEPATGAAAVPRAPVSAAMSDCSPALALILGFIPGVGAIYNGQYGKGLVHAIIFGLLVSIQSSGASAGLEPLFGVLTAAWVFYMALEAYHTAKKRKAGEPVDEFSSLIQLRGQAGSFPIGAVTLIVLGVILLLNTMGILEFQYLIRYWPILLILIGLYMLYTRLHSGGAPVGEREVGDERQ